MQSHILLVTASATGSEALKNLVLPGVGQVTVLDNSFISEADLGNNFFVTKDRVGQPRAQVRAQVLL